MSLLVFHLAHIRRSIVKSSFGKRVTVWVEAHTGLAVEHIVGAALALLVVLTFCGLGASFLTNVVGIVYPAYCSIHAIETDGKEDDVEWLVYWLVYATFSTLEHVVDYVIFWIPFFFPLKLCFLMWCFLPQYKGANIIYAALAPVFRQHESKPSIHEGSRKAASSR